MQARYGKSPGGYVWALLEPLGMILILSYGFQLLLRSPSLGSSFILFYATGTLPYQMYGTMVQVASNALSFNRALLTYPVVLWIDALASRVILNVLTAVLVGTILLTAILVLVDARAILLFGPIVEAYLLAIAFGVGVGSINCVAYAFFPIWKSVYSIITRPLFLASGIIYIYEDLPRFAQELIWWNPLIHITATMRSGFYPMYEPQWVDLTYVSAWAAVTVALGLVLMRRYNRHVLSR